jgi:cytochrome c biogenesis protein CcdA
MRCFVHHDQEAVGTCRVCNKGLCPDCVVDLGHAISCRGACEREAEKIHAQSIHSRAILSAQQRNRFLGPVLFIFLGLVISGLGLSVSSLGLSHHDPSFIIAITGGVGCIIFGLVLLALQRRIYKTIDRNQT